MLDGGALLPGGEVAVVGLAGVVLMSRDAGHSFTLEQQSDRTGLSAAIAVGGEAVVVVGESGARLLQSAAGAPGKVAAGPGADR